MQKHKPLLLLFLFATFFIFYFYGEIIIHPNDHLNNGGGDGINGYYTFAYHIKHDWSYLHFGGMNYPYGEYLLYTDSHPILVTTLKWLSTKFSFFSEHAIGMLNLLLIASIYLSFFVDYFLLREFKIKPWLAVFFAIIMTLLAPQVFRMDAHYALSYSIAIPMSWLMLMKYLKRPSNRFWLVALLINNGIWMFVHAYLGMIILSFLLMVISLQFAFDKKRKLQRLKYLACYSIIFIPIAIFYGANKWTDTHLDRTDNPSGFFGYNAELDDIFVPHHGPIKYLLDQSFGDVIKLKWEAWSYVGFPTTILFSVLVILFLISLVRRKKHYFLEVSFSQKSLNISFFAGLIVLLFALGIPFKQLPVLVDIFPLLKQFRATGRFAWPFYFVSLTLAAFIFQFLYETWKDRISLLSASIFLAFILLIYSAEGLSYHQDIATRITKSSNFFKETLRPKKYNSLLSEIDPNEFQAILPLPFFYYGSESYSRPRYQDNVQSAMIVSYATGIPIISAVLPRSSISESKNIVQLVSPDFYKKEIKKDLPNDKPFLIIKSKTKLSLYEKQILAKGELIASAGGNAFYRLDPEKLFQSSQDKLLERYKNLKPNLFQRMLFETTDSSAFLYYNDFEETPSPIAFRGSGAYQGTKKGRNTFAEFAPHTFETGKTYQLSLWMHNGKKDALNLYFRLIVEAYDADAQQWSATTFLVEEAETIFGDWSLVEFDFKVKQAKDKISIFSKGPDDSKALLHADDLLIREKGMDVYRLEETSGVFFFNNHFMK